MFLTGGLDMEMRLQRILITLSGNPSYSIGIRFTLLASHIIAFTFYCKLPFHLYKWKGKGKNRKSGVSFDRNVYEFC